MLIPVC